MSKYKLEYQGRSVSLKKKNNRLYIFVKDIGLLSGIRSKTKVGMSTLISSSGHFDNGEYIKILNKMEEEKHCEYFHYGKPKNRKSRAVSYEGILFFSNEIKKHGMSLIERGRIGHVLMSICNKDNWPKIETEPQEELEVQEIVEKENPPQEPTREVISFDEGIKLIVQNMVKEEVSVIAERLDGRIRAVTAGINIRSAVNLESHIEEFNKHVNICNDNLKDINKHIESVDIRLGQKIAELWARLKRLEDDLGVVA